jgi:hypothetical protein
MPRVAFPGSLRKASLAGDDTAEYAAATQSPHILHVSCPRRRRGAGIGQEGRRESVTQLVAVSRQSSAGVLQSAAVTLTLMTLAGGGRDTRGACVWGV